MASAPLMPLDAMLASIPSLPRPVLSRLVARMIDRLDDMEPDPDMEDDDPAGTMEDRGEPDGWRPDGFELPRPLYAIDQTEGPTNARAVNLSWHRHINGLA